jgi:hypothetical protein
MRHIGVDLSSKMFTTCFLGENDDHRLATFPMTAEGREAFRVQLRPDARVAVEVGRNSYVSYDQVAGSVAEVVLVAARQFTVIAQSKKTTDRNDALVLARFLKLWCLPAVVRPAPRIRELRQLFKDREELVQMGQHLKSIGHAALERNGLTSRKADFAFQRGRTASPGWTGCPHRIASSSTWR